MRVVPQPHLSHLEFARKMRVVPQPHLSHLEFAHKMRVVPQPRLSHLEFARKMRVVRLEAHYSTPLMPQPRLEAHYSPPLMRWHLLKGASSCFSFSPSTHSFFNLFKMSGRKSRKKSTNAAPANGASLLTPAQKAAQTRKRNREEREALFAGKSPPPLWCFCLIGCPQLSDRSGQPRTMAIRHPNLGSGAVLVSPLQHFYISIDFLRRPAPADG
jgi:hypothetical protein